MERQRFLNEDEICEILNSDSDSDISDLDSDFILENNERECESEIENDLDGEANENAVNSDAMFIAKNKMVWSATPPLQMIGNTAENIISRKPGPTRFSVSRCNDILSTFLCFFPPQIERIIIENTNNYGKLKFYDKWTDIDEDTLRAYIAVLILAGVYRYVVYCSIYFGMWS